MPAFAHATRVTRSRAVRQRLASGAMTLVLLVGSVAVEQPVVRAADVDAAGAGPTAEVGTPDGTAVPDPATAADGQVAPGDPAAAYQPTPLAATAPVVGTLGTCPIGARVWDGSAGTGVWETAQNWVGDVVPSASEGACLLASSPVASVRISSPVRVAAIYAEKPLTVAGGSLSVGATSEVASLTLGAVSTTGDLSAGADVRLGSLSWLGGRISGIASVVVSGDATVGSTLPHSLEAFLATYGTTTVTAPASSFQLAGTTQWRNLGVIEFSDGGGVADDGGVLESKLVNTPNATLRRSKSTTGRDLIPGVIDVAVENQGTLVADGGILQFQSLSQGSTSTWEVHVRGTASGIDYGVVTGGSSGRVTIAGRLNIVTVAPYAPAVGEAISFGTIATDGGGFYPVDGAAISATRVYRLPAGYAGAPASSLSLTVDAVRSDIRIRAIPPSQATVGSPISIQFDVLAGLDYDPVPSATVSISPPANATVLKVDTGQGTCTLEPLECTVGDIAPGETAQVMLDVVPASLGTFSVSATVSSPVLDVAGGDNTTTATVPTLAGPAIPVDRSFLSDFTGDGRADRADWVPETGAWWVSVNRGGTTFDPAVRWLTVANGADWVPFGAGRYTAPSGTVTADASSDIAWFNSSTKAVQFLRSTGSGFVATTATTIGTGVRFIFQGEFTDDTLQDVAVYDSTTNVVTAYRSGGSTLTAAFSYDLDSVQASGYWRKFAPLVANFVGARISDPAFFNWNTKTWWVLHSQTTNGGRWVPVQFGRPLCALATCDWARTAAGDFDFTSVTAGQKNADIAMFNRYSANWHVNYQLTGATSTWPIRGDLPADGAWGRAFTGKLNADSYEDLLTLDSATGAWVAALGGPSGVPMPVSTWLAPDPSQPPGTAFAFADVTGDGLGDLTYADANGVITTAASGASGMTAAPWGVLPRRVITRQYVVGGDSVGAAQTATMLLTVTNPNAFTVTFPSTSVTLPAGFAFIAGSESGPTFATKPLAGCTTCTWTGAFSAPPNSTFQMRYQLRTSSTAGDYPLRASVPAVQVPTATDGTTVSVRESIDAGRTLGAARPTSPRTRPPGAAGARRTTGPGR